MLPADITVWFGTDKIYNTTERLCALGHHTVESTRPKAGPRGHYLSMIPFCLLAYY